MDYVFNLRLLCIARPLEVILWHSTKSPDTVYLCTLNKQVFRLISTVILDIKTLQGDRLEPNPVSGHIEPNYAHWKNRFVRYCVTYPITLFCITLMFFAMLCTFSLQEYAEQ